MLGYLWRIWSKSLGYKVSEVKGEADLAAVFRTIWLVMQAVTCLTIIAYDLAHW